MDSTVPAIENKEIVVIIIIINIFYIQKGIYKWVISPLYVL